MHLRLEKSLQPQEQAKYIVLRSKVNLAIPAKKPRSILEKLETVSIASIWNAVAELYTKMDKINEGKKAVSVSRPAFGGINAGY